MCCCTRAFCHNQSQVWCLFWKENVPKIISYWQLMLSKMRAFCCKICLFLSNSGRRMLCRVTTCCVITWPDKVLIFLPLERSFRSTPVGRLDFLMRQQEAPEPRECWTITCCGLHLWCWPCKLLQMFCSWEWFLVHENSIPCHHWRLHTLQVRLWKHSLQNHCQWCHTWWCCLSWLQKNLN